MFAVVLVAAVAMSRLVVPAVAVVAVDVAEECASVVVLGLKRAVVVMVVVSLEWAAVVAGICVVLLHKRQHQHQQPLGMTQQSFGLGRGSRHQVASEAA